MQFRDVMNLNVKILKYLDAGNCNRLKDYICFAYDHYNPSPETVKKHPCYDLLKEAAEFIQKDGWKVKGSSWDDQGYQIVVISPAGEHYRSRYKHFNN